MTTYRHRQIVREDGARFTARDRFDLNRTVEDLAVGRSLALVTLLIKAQPTDTDAEALVSKAITAVAQAGIGQITQAGTGAPPDRTGAFTFEVMPADSDNVAVPAVPGPGKLGAGRTYYYTMVLQLDNGDKSTYEEGTIRLARNLKVTA